MMPELTTEQVQELERLHTCEVRQLYQELGRIVPGEVFGGAPGGDHELRGRRWFEEQRGRIRDIVCQPGVLSEVDQLGDALATTTALLFLLQAQMDWLQAAIAATTLVKTGLHTYCGVPR